MLTFIQENTTSPEVHFIVTNLNNSIISRAVKSKRSERAEEYGALDHVLLALKVEEGGHEPRNVDSL